MFEVGKFLEVVGICTEKCGRTQESRTDQDG